MNILDFEVTPETLSSLIGLGGIGIAALFGGIGYALRLRGERLSTRRSVLFYLLEIRHRIGSQLFDPVEIANSYLDECKEYFVKKNIPEDCIKAEDFLPLMTQLFASIFDALKRKLDQELMEPFHHAVIALSRENPILAYRLYGLSSIEDAITSQNGAIRSIIDHPDLNEDTDLKAVLPLELRRVRDRGIQDISEDLDTLIKDVAKTCSIFDFFKAHKILKSRKITAEINFSELGAAQALDEILARMEQAIRDQKLQSPTVSNPSNTEGKNTEDSSVRAEENRT